MQAPGVPAPVSRHPDTSQVSSPPCICVLPSTGEVRGEPAGWRAGGPFWGDSASVSLGSGEAGLAKRGFLFPPSLLFLFS